MANILFCNEFCYILSTIVTKNYFSFNRKIHWLYSPDIYASTAVHSFRVPGVSIQLRGCRLCLKTIVKVFLKRSDHIVTQATQSRWRLNVKKRKKRPRIAFAEEICTTSLLVACEKKKGQDLETTRWSSHVPNRELTVNDPLIARILKKKF